MFAQQFSCGSSVTGEDEVVVQGDVADSVIEFIKSQWPEVNHKIDLSVPMTTQLS